MNTRSLKFRLIAWYAGALTACFAALGTTTYFVLQTSLIRALKETQFRRARQISQMVSEELERKGSFGVGNEVDVRYAPALNDRFVRITQRDGVTLYLSPMPKSQNFDPATLPPPLWPDGPESSRQISLLGGRKMLLTAHALKMPSSSFLIEAGAPMDDVQSELRKWVLFLASMLPIVIGVALAGGTFLVRRALLPVDQIAATAERISSKNLSERLPVPPSGDELERLSLALNRMIERLDAAFRYSRRFVADASHELRTPLTVLRAELESLVQQPQYTDEWRERAGSALEEVNRVAKIVEGLFAISRLDAGEAAAEWLPLDLAQLASSTADQMSLLAEDKNIKVSCEANSSIWVEGDKARLKQVVVNLLDNAIKYTPRGGSVALSVGARESKAVLDVADSGIGIPSEALPRVFERFFRVDEARSRDQGGAGLGLAIAKSICTAHQGSIEAISSLGRGSRFRVELPLASPPSNGQHRKNSREH